jgi:signal peptidase I
MEHMGELSFLTMFDDQLDDTHCEHDRDCGGSRSCRAGVCGIAQGPFKVAPGEVWVMGDNRNNSHDSRSWRGGLGGGVPFENIKGRAMFVWFSWDERTRGVRFYRVFDQVMGHPKLPPQASELQEGLKRCYAARPPVSQTTPPSPTSR